MVLKHVKQFYDKKYKTIPCILMGKALNAKNGMPTGSSYRNPALGGVA